VELALQQNVFDFIYALEPLRSNFELLVKRHGGTANVVLMNCAADVASGEAMLYRGNDEFGDTGGSLCQGMLTTSSKTERVRTVDFSEFLKQQFAPEDYIVLKLDIEGKEYDVLSKLIDDGMISRVQDIYCEWHFSWIGMSPRDHFRFVRKLRALGFDLCGNKDYDEFINVHDWSRARLALARHAWWYRYRLRQACKPWVPATARDFLRRIWP
jgi:FkbM family methyltransferase